MAGRQRYSRRRPGVKRHQLLDQPAACRRHQAQLLRVVRKRNGQDAGLVEQIAVEPKRSDHVACVVRHLRESFSAAAQGCHCFHDRRHARAFSGAEGGSLDGARDLLHGLLPFRVRRSQCKARSSEPSPGFPNLISVPDLSCSVTRRVPNQDSEDK